MEETGYRLCEWDRVRDELKRYIPCRMVDLYDQTVSMACGRIILDIFKFRDFLVKEGMNDDESINAFILRKYGVEALSITNKLLLP